MRRALPAVLALAALAGCGDPPDHDRWVARVGDLCQGFDDRARDLAARTARATEDRPRDAAFLRDLAPLLREGVALNAEVLRALRAIPAEGTDRRRQARFEDALGEQVGLLRRQARTAAAGDVRSFAALQDEAEDVAYDRQRAVQRLEVEACLG